VIRANRDKNNSNAKIRDCNFGNHHLGMGRCWQKIKDNVDGYIYTDNRMKRPGPTLLRVEIFSRPSELFYTWPIGIDNSLV